MAPVSNTGRAMLERQVASSSQAGIMIWSRILEQRESIGAFNRDSDRIRAAVLEEALQ